MDVDAIVAKQLKQMEKDMREKETKLRTQEKKVFKTKTHSLSESKSGCVYNCPD